MAPGVENHLAVFTDYCVVVPLHLVTVKYPQLRIASNPCMLLMKQGEFFLRLHTQQL